MGKKLRKLLKKHPQKMQRALEMLPGTATWLVILFPLWGALFMPKFVAYFTIAFLVFWFYRSYMGAFLGIKGWIKIRRSEKTNWYQKYCLEKKKNWLDWHKVRHLILVPNYNESVEKLSITLNYLAHQKNINQKQLWVVLAMEERATDSHQKAEELAQKFKGKFGRLITTFHPDGIVGEVRGKASNEAWAVKQAKKILVDKQGYNIKKIILTTCDADSCFHPKYFSALTYKFCQNRNRYLRFWQSPMFNHNNYWRVPSFIKIVSSLSSILHLAFIQEPDNLFLNYSTYSLSLKMIDDIGYWHTDIIPEDWHIFLQCFFHKKGKVEMEAIFLPTSIDAPEANTYWGSLKNRYEQCKRHAWGATDIPYAIKQSLKRPEISRWARFLRVYKIFECHLLWPTNWFILTLGAWVPTFVNPIFAQTALGYNLPKISQIILTSCLLFLLVIITLDLILKRKKEKISFWRYLAEYLQWVLMPVATLFMAILPAVDAQTRLMLGKRLEYRVTEKI